MNAQIMKAEIGPGQAAVEICGLTKVHNRGARATDVLDNLSLTIAEGEFVAIMGPSGSGKTTLLNLIGGLDKPSDGTIAVRGVPIGRMSRGQLSKWHATQVGFVFQFYNLIPVLTALRNVELPLSLLGVSRGERRRRAAAALDLVGLGDRADHYPAELSGGEQQRVAIARAVVGGPALLLCDEPTGDLDRDTAVEVMELIAMLQREHGKTILLVTHDPAVAHRADRIIHLNKGVIVDEEVPIHA
jgi:putative ABC transport system ATP-binding protein